MEEFGKYNIIDIKIDRNSIKKEKPYPKNFCETNKVIKIEESPDRVIVAVVNTPDKVLIDILFKFHNKEISFKIIPLTEFISLFNFIFDSSILFDSDLGGGKTSEFMLDRIEDDAPVINYVNNIIAEAIEKNVSDIHFESFTDYAIIRERIDGVLAVAGKISLERFTAISSRLKIMSNLNIMEKRLPQDGRITVEISEKKIDIRISFVPIANGESIVLRLFNKETSLLELEDLSIDESIHEAMNRMLKYPHGLILVTGPTGSGKTTTLNAMLKKLQKDSRKIITIEDPIENIIDGINQIQTNESIDLTFGSLLRRVLRQDPDIIMVGEIRDKDTADLVVRSALTGHLVLSTLHTNDSISAVNRLKNIGIESYMISSVLRGVIAQRLVRRLCPHCKRQETIEPGLEEKTNYNLGTRYEPVGCEYCRGTGYKGRFAIFEILPIDEAIENMIIRDEKRSTIREYLNENGILDLKTNAVNAVLQGQTSMEEIEREVEL